MQQSQLNRLLKIISRTGDKCFVLDNQSEQVFSLMPLEAYEDLLEEYAPWEDLSEKEMLDKVSRDISRWREHHDYDAEFDEDDLMPFGGEEKPMTLDENFNSIPDEDESEELPGFEEDEDEDVIARSDSDAAIPENEEPKIIPITSDSNAINKILAEEDLSDVPEDEEEKFYIEPIE